jgi:hypothetical protein
LRGKSFLINHNKELQNKRITYHLARIGTSQYDIYMGERTSKVVEWRRNNS